MTNTEQTFRVEIRFDVYGTLADAEAAASDAITSLPLSAIDPVVSDIADEDWNSV